MPDKTYKCPYSHCTFTSTSDNDIRTHRNQVVHLWVNRETRLKNFKLRQEEEKKKANAAQQREGKQVQVDGSGQFTKENNVMQSGKNNEADTEPLQHALHTRPHVRAATPSVAYEADDEGHRDLKPAIPTQPPDMPQSRSKRKAFPKELRNTGPIQRDMLGRIIHRTLAVAQPALNIQPPEPPFVRPGLIPTAPSLIPRMRTTTNPLVSPPSTKIAIPPHFLHPHLLMGPNIVGPQPWQKRHTHKSLLEQHLRPKDSHQSQNWDRPFVPVEDDNQAGVNACEDGSQYKEADCAQAKMIEASVKLQMSRQ